MVLVLSGEEGVINLTVTGDSYIITGIEPGSYTLTASKKNHVTREYAVIVGKGENLRDITINLIGDINADGIINIGDTAKLYAHICKTALLTDDYALKCADVSGDGRVNIGDVAKIYAHIRKTSLLW